MNSIRARLFAILLTTTGAVWLFAVLWIYASTQAEVERVLDARLTESARMVSSLITDHHIDVAAAVETAARQAGDLSATPAIPYNRQLSCQIWSLQGALVSKSESAPQASLSSHRSGFADTEIGGERWRVYAVVNPALGVRVLVGDSLAIRERLVSHVVKGLLVPAILILPLLAGLIWLSVERGLAPLNDLAKTLSRRAETELHPLVEAPAPREIKPMISALNGLLGRVAQARERERNFTAYAAHELKTPLAGLKTQAQIAIRSDDRLIQQQALGHILTSVDRTSRMVRQLIDLAAVDAGERTGKAQSVDIIALLDDLFSELGLLANGRNVRLRRSGEGLRACMLADRSLVRIALRNVLENAIQHSPIGGEVTCAVSIESRALVVEVRDEGQGIEAGEQERVMQRFYRGQTSAAGSGLGLSIVRMALDRLHGSLLFHKTDGFSVTLRVPES